MTEFEILENNSLNYIFVEMVRRVMRLQYGGAAAVAAGAVAGATCAEAKMTEKRAETAAPKRKMQM